MEILAIILLFVGIIMLLISRTVRRQGDNAIDKYKTMANDHRSEEEQELDEEDAMLEMGMLQTLSAASGAFKLIASGFLIAGILLIIVNYLT